MSNAIYALLEVNSKILRKSTKKLEEKLATWFFYKVIHPRIQPKQLPRIIIQFLRETIGSLTIIRLSNIMHNKDATLAMGFMDLSSFGWIVPQPLCITFNFRLYIFKISKEHSSKF